MYAKFSSSSSSLLWGGGFSIASRSCGSLLFRSIAPSGGTGSRNEQQPQSPLQHPPQSHPQQQRWAHTVRVIVTQDVTGGKLLYQGDIATVAAGYARNYLVPQKLAVYATRQNFINLNVKDPELETGEERQLRLAREALACDDKDLKAADLLKFYLRNKVVSRDKTKIKNTSIRCCCLYLLIISILGPMQHHSRQQQKQQLKIWRNVDLTGSDYNAIAPGVVDAKAVRQKLSKQLKIDLEEHERVHVLQEAVNHADYATERQWEPLLETSFGDCNVKCTTQIKHLGEYMARITLRGGYSIPLKLEVLKR